VLPDRLTSLLGCRWPVQQAPMGSVASPDLVVAVADAGGIGSLTTTGMSTSYLVKVLDEITERTGGVVAANFLTAAIDVDVLELAAARVALVDFFWSDPDPAMVEVAHRAGALVSWQVGSVAEARAAVDAGVDIVIAQGADAGGHVRGRTALLPLLSAVLEAVDVPVLAAGGIGHPRALAGVIGAGASGARIGTAFIATDESGAHPAYKQAVVEARAGETMITDAFANGCPLCATSARHRVLAACVDAVHGLADDTVGEARYGARTIALPKGSPLSPSGTTTGQVGAMAMYASDAAAAVDRIRPAGDVLTWLCEGAERVLAGAPG
jgi:nitronate monooxygenase